MTRMRGARFTAEGDTVRYVAPRALGLAGIAAVLLSAGVTHVAVADAPATDLRTVSPVDASGQLKDGYRVVRTLRHATCQNGSYLTGVADRCSTPATRHGVLDPCWPTATAKTFVCQRKPWQHRVVEVHATGPASGGPGHRDQGLPWGMRVGNNVRCLLDPGSVRRLDGHQLLSHCSHHRDVFGPLRHGGAHWRAHVYRAGAHTQSGYRGLGWKIVRIAWYGAPAPDPSPPLPLPTLTATPTGE
jgi:hypothetical protein